jgi:glycosyltransferase involved in cell wall biosynthesis
VRIGLRVLSNPQWRGGINYIVNWSAALGALPAGERPEIILLPFDAAGEELARHWPVKVDGIAPFSSAAELDLDFIYPVTQIFEAPFGVPWAGWIPDWQCQYLPDMFSPLERARRELHYGLLAREAPVLVLSSQMALQDTERLIPDMVEAHVLHFPALLSDSDIAALSQSESLRAKFGLPERYVIVCNQFWRHKNHRVVLEALARVQSPDLVCVMTGEMHDERWPDYVAELQSLLAQPEIASRTRVLGSISRAEQLALMAGAIAIVQPSLFEGWSTVVEEGRLLGVPSLLSRFPVHMEQNPPGSRFFDPQNPDELAALLDDIWRTPIERSRFEQAKAAQATFSAACARAFLTVARAAKKNYVSRTNDPLAILARMLERMPDSPAGSIEAELEHRFYAGLRAMMKSHPQHLEALLAYCQKEGNLAVSRAKTHVADVLNRQLTVTKLVERAVGPAASPRVTSWLEVAAKGVIRLLSRMRKSLRA